MTTERCTFSARFGRILPLLLCLLSPTAWSVGVDSKLNLIAVSVDRYTANGLPGTAPGLLRAKQEIGDLYKNGNFIPTAVQDDRSIEIDQASLDAISGKYVMPLALWTTFSEGAKPVGNSDAMKFFPRSAQTYSINGVPYVIVTPGGGSGSGGKPTVSISAVQAGAAEAGPIGGRFLIALNAAAGRNIKVSYAVLGKARNGKDYRRIARSVLIPAGNVSAYVDIQPIDDGQAEGTETVSLKLIPSPAYRLGTPRSAVVSIADND